MLQVGTSDEFRLEPARKRAMWQTGAQKTPSALLTKGNRLTLYGEVTDICYGVHMNSPCEQTGEFMNVKAVGA
jgi:hypothetical protein